MSTNTSNRRDFLKKGITGAAGLTLLPVFSRGQENRSAPDETGKKKIVYRTLGKTGLKVPVISFGCGNTQNANLVGTALDMGMRHLDTAHGYGGGMNEVIVGEAVKDRPRDSFIVATKIEPLQDNRTGSIAQTLGRDISPADFRKDLLEKLEQSLKRLKLPYVDIFYLHAMSLPDNIKLPLVKELMQEIKKQGKAKYLGVSIHQNEAEMVRTAVDEKIYDVVLVAYNFRQPHREEVKKAIAYAAKAGLGVIGMKMMAGAYWDRERRQPIDSTAAMKWVLQDENIHTIIPGITSFDHLEADMAIMENLAMTPDEWKNLRLGEASGLAGLYCAQCGQCTARCRYGLDIPTAMRAYMYAYGYRQPAKAAGVLKKKELAAISCRECYSCAVTCQMGFDVPTKLKDIIRLVEVPEDFLV